MALTTKASTDIAQQVDPSQTLRAATALLRNITSHQATRKETAEKTSLLADADEDEVADETPIWLVLTTKKHIIDKKRLKPGKIALPHPYLNTADSSLRICLISADPQRKYKDLIAHQSFPLDLAKRVGRVIGMTKLKAKYKSYESRRQLLSEYDVFLADDRIITYLPQVLGKVFYKGGSKRPIPVTLEGKRQNLDEQGNKRRKLSEGGTKVTKTEVKPSDVAREIERTLSSTLVHLVPSITTSVKVGKSSMEPQQLQENVDVVTQALVEKYVPQKWRNVRSMHIKGPSTAALPIYMTDELWEDEKDVLEEPLPVKDAKRSKKRKASALAQAAAENGEGPEVIEVPGPDGQTRRVKKALRKQTLPDAPPVKPSKKGKSEGTEEVDAKAAERAEKAARKEALQMQKVAAKAAVNGTKDVSDGKITQNGETKKVRKTRMKAADMI
ncbi:proteasome-interacting protein cic1 [Vermiconidia calcicola]|uniref:Proteasome-interacting protein cic1 n=1 Tax=Vermiconidia calcicola TaxID=1690605 RepID=A0ACC3MVV9_9PEZI|nr:proteasome-interacting protein cic1 [Vermiconidia calcicola]